jgi:hypothetical protein
MPTLRQSVFENTTREAYFVRCDENRVASLSTSVNGMLPYL